MADLSRDKVPVRINGLDKRVTTPSSRVLTLPGKMTPTLSRSHRGSLLVTDTLPQASIRDIILPRDIRYETHASDQFYLPRQARVVC